MKDYDEALHRRKPKDVNFSTITSKNYQLYSINQTKIGLTSYDNKMFWVNDVDSVPYGHHSIQKWVILTVQFEQTILLISKEAITTEVYGG